MKNKKLRSKKGITLIALVVTIVVLLILAGVSINLIFSNDGIIKKAQEAADAQKEAMEKDQQAINDLGDELNRIINATTGTTAPTAGTIVAKPGTWTSNVVTPIADGNGGTVPLPNDFYYVGGDYDTGLVISDKQGDTMTASGTSMGNQFVWIPVAGEAVLTRTEFDTSTGQPITGLSEYYSEPCSTGYSTEASEYNTMRTQVLKYGGFYIGRFEAGINSTKLRTGATAPQTVVSKKGVAPYNYVQWGASMTNAEHVTGNSAAVKLAKNFATQEGYTSVTSTLCYGSQWDAMCRYIEDCHRTTPGETRPGLTGSVSTDVLKNIYDLAGNCMEWTMETYNDQDMWFDRVRRGGSSGGNTPVCERNHYGVTGFNDGIGFRCAIYIK